MTAMSARPPADGGPRPTARRWRSSGRARRRAAPRASSDARPRSGDLCGRRLADGVPDALSRRRGIDWSRVDAFHLDEYVGLPLGRPAVVRDVAGPAHLVAACMPGRIEKLDGGSAETNGAAECARYGALIDDGGSTSHSSGWARTATSRSTTRTSPTSTTRSPSSPWRSTTRAAASRSATVPSPRSTSPRLAMTVTMSAILAEPRHLGRRPRGPEGRRPSPGRSRGRSRPPVPPPPCAATPMRCCSSTRRRSRTSLLTATRSDTQTALTSRSTAGRPSEPRRSAAGRCSAGRRRSCCSRRSGPVSGARIDGTFVQAVRARVRRAPGRPPRRRDRQRDDGPVGGAQGARHRARATRSSCPPYTFIATASAALMLGAIPVFVDVDPETLLIDAGAASTRR